MKTSTTPRESGTASESPLTREEVAARLVAINDRAERRALLASLLPRLDIDDFLPFLKSETERQFSINGYTSLRFAEILIDAAELSDQPNHRALGLLSSADAYRILGRYAESLEQYEEARRDFAALGNEVGWARTFIGWIHAANWLGRGREALETVGAAHDVFIRHGEQLMAARLDQNTALVHLWMGDYTEALHYFDRAQRIAEDAGPQGIGIATRAKNNKADLYALRGEFDTALALYADARASYERRGATRSIHRQDFFIADLHVSRGEFTRGLRLYTDVLAALEAEGQEADAAEARLRLAACYLSLNRYHEALELAEETVIGFERCGSPLLAAKARFACALAHARLGDNSRALDLLQDAAKTFAAADFSADVGLAMLQRAYLYLSDADWCHACEEAERAHRLFMERGVLVRQTQADVARARALFGLGMIAEAEHIAHAALETAGTRNLLWLSPECHHLLASVARAHNDLPRALVECQRAIATIEQMQSRLAIELRTAFLGDKLQVYHDAIDCCLALADPRQAFRFLERAKSRALVEYLVTNPNVRLRSLQDADQTLVDELRRLREEHNWLYNRLYGYGITQEPSNAQTQAEGAALEVTIRDRERRIGRLLERLALHRSEGSEQDIELIASTDNHLALPSLDPHTMLLEYYFHERGGVVFVIVGQELTVVDLDTSLADVRRLVQRWQLNIETTARAAASQQPLNGLARTARGNLQALYRALVAPVAELLATHTETTRLIIVPYGPAHAVPFHALFDGSRHLIESFEISICPSSDVLRLCDARMQQRTAAQTALLVTYSDGGRLPFICEETRTVAAFFPGETYEEERATRTALMEAAPRHGIVHLAAHGEARLDNPTFAHLKLADGQLSPTDIFNLNLNGALVTLSGCETGRSTVIGGDELIGLSRGFLHAGAATLVQSLWRVEDGSTARLMAHFYAALRSGDAPGTALREAQRMLLADPASGIHPFFWAPFQLVGASRQNRARMAS